MSACVDEYGQALVKKGSVHCRSAEAKKRTPPAGRASSPPLNRHRRGSRAGGMNLASQASAD
jgi:hypothetical protein